jgi:hypothetical protein
MHAACSQHVSTCACWRRRDVVSAGARAARTRCRARCVRVAGVLRAAALMLRYALASSLSFSRRSSALALASAQQPGPGRTARVLCLLLLYTVILVLASEQEQERIRMYVYMYMPQAHRPRDSRQRVERLLVSMKSINNI